MFQKLTQSNTRFQALDARTVHVHSVRMAVDFGKRAERSKGRPLYFMAHIKQNGVRGKTKIKINMKKTRYDKIDHSNQTVEEVVEFGCRVTMEKVGNGEGYFKK